MSTAQAIFTVDTKSQVPVYEQLVQCVTDGIASGSLEAGDRIPPVRSLATELGLAAGTVAKAYRTMEASGVIETRGRKGTLIAQSSDDRHAAACRAAAEYLDRAAGDLHYSPEECLQIVQRMLDQRAVD